MRSAFDRKMEAMIKKSGLDKALKAAIRERTSANNMLRRTPKGSKRHKPLVARYDTADWWVNKVSALKQIGRR